MTPHQHGIALLVAEPSQPRIRERRNLAARHRLVARLKGEFEEMPGLRLTAAQASRFLGLEPAACARLLGELVTHGVLATTGSGHYVRRSSDR